MSDQSLTYSPIYEKLKEGMLILNPVKLFDCYLISCQIYAGYTLLILLDLPNKKMLISRDLGSINKRMAKIDSNTQFNGRVPQLPHHHPSTHYNSNNQYNSNSTAYLNSHTTPTWHQPISPIFDISPNTLNLIFLIFSFTTTLLSYFSIASQSAAIIESFFICFDLLTIVDVYSVSGFGIIADFVILIVLNLGVLMLEGFIVTVIIQLLLRSCLGFRSILTFFYSCYQHCFSFFTALFYHVIFSHHSSTFQVVPLKQSIHAIIFHSFQTVFTEILAHTRTMIFLKLNFYTRDIRF